MPEHFRVALVVLAVLCSSAREGVAQGIPDSLRGRTIVTYATGQSVYIGAGHLDGVWIGSRVMIVRGGALIGEVRVRYLSSHAASCELVAGTSGVQPADSVRFSLEPRGAAPRDSATKVVAATKPRATRNISWARSAGIRGRVGMSYLVISPRDSGQGRITQPAADLRVEGYNVGGSSLSFIVDARTRRTYAEPAGGASSVDAGTRVYQASLSWSDPSSGARVTLGRQYSNALSPVSLYDGATIEVDKRRWAGGIFGGTQPGYASLSLSGEIREYGGYVQLHQTQRPPGELSIFRRWSLTMGGIGSYDHSALNREFMFAQVQYNDRRLFLFATQEVDYNRGWKRDLGESVLSPTSTFATAQLQLTDEVSVHTGFDNRRNVRLYRDFISPETAFDDSFREGYWGGVSVMALRHSAIGARRAPEQRGHFRERQLVHRDGGLRAHPSARRERALPSHPLHERSRGRVALLERHRHHSSVAPAPRAQRRCARRTVSRRHIARRQSLGERPLAGRRCRRRTRALVVSSPVGKPDDRRRRGK